MSSATGGKRRTQAGTTKKTKKTKKSGRRYGKAASKKVGRALHEAKRGKLRSGRSKKKVRSRAQAIAIGLSEARRQGAKVPAKKGRGKKKTTSKKASRKKKKAAGKKKARARR